MPITARSNPAQTLPIRLTKESVGNAMVIHSEKPMTERAKMFAFSVPVEKVPVVVLDLPPWSPSAVWEALVKVFPRGRRVVRVLPVPGHNQTMQMGLWLANQLRRNVVVPVGNLVAVGGSLFIPPAAYRSGWVECAPGMRSRLLGRRFPSPHWECAVACEPFMTEGAVAEPVPGGLWIRPAALTGAVSAYYGPLSRLAATRPNSMTIVLGAPGPSSVHVEDVVQAVARLPEELRQSQLSFVLYGPVSGSDGIAPGQALANRLGRPVVIRPASSPPVEDVSGSAPVPATFALELGYLPAEHGGPARPAEILAHREPLSGLVTLSRTSYAYPPDAVLEVVPTGLLVRPPDGGVHTERVRAMVPGLTPRLLFDTGPGTDVQRMRQVAEEVRARLDPGTIQATDIASAAEIEDVTAAVSGNLEATGDSDATQIVSSSVINAAGKAAGSTAAESSQARPSAWLVALCCLGAFMAFLDATIVNVAFPDMVAAFPGDALSSLSWVLNGYNVVVAAFLLPAGRLADRLGCRRAFMTGLAIFTLASVACGIANSAWLLVGARLVQAAGAAILVPTSLALLLALFPAHRRLPAVTIWAASAAIAAGVGPTVGGLLVQDWSWRAVFLVNVPIGIAAVWGSRYLREQRERSGPTPDILGAVLLAVSLGLVSLGLVKANDWNWVSVRTIGCLAAGVLMLALVVLRSGRHPAPVITLGLLRSRDILGGNLGSLLYSVGYFGMILNNVLFLTGQWHFSVLQAGLCLTPGPMFTALVARPASRLAERFGSSSVTFVGCLLAAGGTGYLMWGAGHAPNFLAYWLPGGAICGVGAGMALPILGLAALTGVPLAELGTASAANSAFRQLGAVLGTALTVSTLAAVTDPLGGSRASWWIEAGFFVAAGTVAFCLLRGGRGAARDAEPTGTASAAFGSMSPNPFEARLR